MQPIRAWLCYLFLVLLGGALMAPWLYCTAQFLGAHFPDLEHLARSPFHRFVDRSLLILALGGLWPFLRRVGVYSWLGVGLTTGSGNGKNIALGFVWGLASLALVAGITFCAGVRTWNVNLTAALCVKAFSSAIISAVVVSVVEELLFRGALLGSLRRTHRWSLALLVSSGFYALVHFFQRPQSPPEINWLSGFVVLGRMLAGFVDLQLVLPGLLTLLLAGGILGLAFLRTGTLYQSIGLHAGWIFWLKFYGLIAIETPAGRDHPSFWGTAKLFDGWLAFIILLPVLLIFWRNYSRFDERSLDTRTEKLV